MTKINLRKSINFINSIFKKDLAQVLKDEGQGQARLQNIAWPSEASAQLGSIPVGECKRSMFYKIIGIAPTEPMSITGKFTCDAGSLYEAYHINRFKNQGVLKDTQVPIEFLIPESRNKVQVRGRMDCVIEHNGSKAAIEIKSVSEYKAAKIMDSDLPLPAPNNLMQAMLYKYYLSETEAGKALDIEEVYLMYVNRSTGATFYFKVDLEEGYPVITAFDLTGAELWTIKLKDVKSFSELESSAGIASSYEARMAELRINIKDIFDKFDEIYDYTTKKTLPPCDYRMIYTEDQAKKEYSIGRISKIKYNKTKKGEPIGDSRCAYCDFRTKCMSDNGITLK